LQIQRADSPRPPFHQSNHTILVGKNPLVVSFDPQPDPPGQSYRVQITCPADSCAGVQIFGRSDPESDPTGWAALPNGASYAADLAYTTTYAYTGRSILADAWTLLRQSPFIFLALLIAWLPGWVLLNLFSPPTDANRLPQSLANALALSLALIPLLLLWTGTTGIAWQGWGVGLAAAAFGGSGLFLLFRLVRTSKSRPASKRRAWNQWLVVVFLASLLVRLAMVRDLAAPPWVDAFHHALFTRLILDLGAFPATLEPYLSLAPAAYHPGFHASLALFTQLSALDLPASMLLFGQVLNALIVVPVYALTHALTKSRRAALAAALAAGLLSPMPAYYTSWSRYTHLAGLLILPGFVLLARSVVLPAPIGQGPNLRRTLSGFALPALAFGGLILVHYRVAAFAALFAIFDCLWQIQGTAQPQRAKFIAIAHSLTRLAAIGLAGALLAGPWLVTAIEQSILPTALQPASQNATWLDGFSVHLLTSASGPLILVAAGLGLAVAFYLRPRMALILVSWAMALLVIANLDAMGLPGSGLINQTAVTISLFLPLTMLAGWAADRMARLAEWSARQAVPKTRQLNLLWAILALITGVAGAARLVPLLNPGTFLLRQADLAGLAWAAQNLPEVERVVVNPFNWGYDLYAPADGGGWLAGLSARTTIPSPVIAGLETNQRLIDEQQLSATVIRLANDPENLAASLRQAGVGYVFVGRRGGVLAPHLLLRSPAFEPVYNLDGVRIFKVLPER
jgi:hypothetical protein